MSEIIVWQEPPNTGQATGSQDAPRTLNNQAGLQLLGLSVLKKSAGNLQIPTLISGFLQQ